MLERLTDPTNPNPKNTQYVGHMHVVLMITRVRVCVTAVISGVRVVSVL